MLRSIRAHATEALSRALRLHACELRYQGVPVQLRA